MTDTNPGGWPDPQRPGVPLNPEREGDHMMAVTDEHGRVWYEVWRWRATSKPPVWLRPNPQGGPYGYEARHLDAPCYSFIRYLGPSLTPQEVAALVAEAKADDPQYDATDAAHPAWWRGNDHGVAAVVQIINDTLDGKAPGTYGSADLTSAIRRVAAARADGMQAGISAGMDEGAEAAVRVLASWLGVKQWEGGDGTETWEGDLSVEIGNVLAASDIYDSETGNVATHALLRAAREDGMREAAGMVRTHAAAAKKCSQEGDVIHRIRAEYLSKAFALNFAADDIEAAILAAIPEPAP